jgi:Holliday junction DNA helicase RuvA
MIGMISGKLVHVGADGVLVDVAGVGYRLLCPAPSLAGLPKVGSPARLHTHLHVREDALTLYGFATAEERDVFEVLIGVNGIGPKGGLAILSVYSPDALRKAVLAEDLDALTLIPGVGRKTAARMILELKEKLSPGGEPALAGGSAARPAVAEARTALLQLGYSTTEAREALDAVAAGNGHGETAEELLRIALKRLGSR